MNYAIKIENLSKKYVIGHNDSGSLRHKLSGAFQRKKTEEFWALKDVNLTVAKGETLGIIGRNGAGKSTLLKILSRITPPSTGRVSINGRVASLLEVGTGFHPELTGRENIYLNGSLLGMTRSEIKNKLDEIIDFSGVERFIDTPVKHYSSGMYVRLAFSVAAHLNTEILIIDEVLAVGDAAFQKKCLGRMDSLSNEGRTVVLVSHQLGYIKSNCSRVIWFDTGKLVEDGDSKMVCNNYLREMVTIKPSVNSGILIKWNNEDVDQGIVSYSGQRVEITIESVYKIEDKMEIHIVFYDEYGSELFVLNSRWFFQIFGFDVNQSYKCILPRLQLNFGYYFFKVRFLSYKKSVRIIQERMVKLQVSQADFFGTGNVIGRQRKLLIEHKWQK